MEFAVKERALMRSTVVVIGALNTLHRGKGGTSLVYATKNNGA
tara:strand:+ start:285 stop:413 length:129 start_codon:yes stop_codon:yes gene_type:complete